MEWITLVATSAVVSAVISGVLTLINAHLQRKAEDRKRLAELAMKMAMSEWEKHLEMAKAGQGSNVQPPEIYLYRYSLLIPLIENGQLTPESLSLLDKAVLEVVNKKDK
ncbi:TPA: hypothetical protein ACG0LC_001088 [Citrobacter sedlakii]